MTAIYSFLLHFVALIASMFHAGPAESVRFAAQEVAPHHPVEAAIRAPDTGYWHTQGNQILDRQNHPVRIQGINWYGFETVREVPGGLTEQDYRIILQAVRANGFNSVRIPLSNQMVETPSIPTAISFRNARGPINTDLRGLNSLQILDRIVEYAGELGLKVILDNHRSEDGDSGESNGLWYTAQYPESHWIADWQMLAQRYAGNSTVIGLDLRNEPHNASSTGSCWDCGGDRDWHLAAERAGNAVLRVNPRLLIFVEGVDTYDNDSTWWGGNLEGVRRSPVQLEVPGQLVYSAHSYGPNEYRQKWFNPQTTAASIEAVETRHWAYISLEGIAPVWLGEFGTTNRTEDLGGIAPGSEGQWFQTLVGLLARNPQLSWTSWALNGEDPNGLLDARYNPAPANPLKMQMLARIESLALPAAAENPAVQQATLGNTAQYAILQQASYESPRPNASSSPACRISYSNQNDTGYGATEIVEIENLSNQPVDGWTLMWSYNGSQQVEEVRNARYIQNGDTVMMTNNGGNGVIPAGGKLTGIAVTTSYRGLNHSPVKFYLNGSLCG